MQAQAGNCTVTVQLKGHEIIGYETGGDDWRYGHILSHAIFEAVEKTTATLKAKPARKRPKIEPLQEPAAPAKSESSQDPANKVKTESGQEPAVKTEPKRRLGKKVNEARDRPIKAEEEEALVDLVSEDEKDKGQEGEYVEEDGWI